MTFCCSDGVSSTMPSSRSGTGLPSCTTSLGSRPGGFATSRTVPVSGAASSGETARALPTIEFAGHEPGLAANVAAGQVRASAPASGETAGGSSTTLRRIPASPSRPTIVVVTGIEAPFAVRPGAPIVPCTEGANGWLAQLSTG